MDFIQTILLAVIIVLTIFLVVIGFQVIFTLRDLRKTLTRANKLFDNAHDLIGEVKKPIESAGQIAGALIAGAGLSRFLKKGEKDERREK